MKSIKMLGLAALAALAAMAFMGTPAAMGGSTVLCEADEGSCAAANVVTHVHESGFASLLTVIPIECEVLFLGDTLNEGSGSPLIIHGTFTYACKNNCTVTEEEGPAEIEVLRTANELGTVTPEALVHVVCGLNCRYNGVGLEAHALGALTAGNETGEVVLNEQELNKESGTFCPEITKLDITTEPLVESHIVKTSLVGSKPTALCQADESPCASKNIITHLHEGSVGHALLLSSFATVQCTALFLGETLNSGLGSPLVIHGNFTYTCLSGCTAIEENGPAEIKAFKTVTELAIVIGEGLIHVECGLNCRYNGVGLAGHALGALTAENGVGEVTIGEQEVNKESGFLCPKTSKLDIVTEPLSTTYISA